MILEAQNVKGLWKCFLITLLRTFSLQSFTSSTGWSFHIDFGTSILCAIIITLSRKFSLLSVVDKKALTGPFTSVLEFLSFVYDLSTQIFGALKFNFVMMPGVGGCTLIVACGFASPLFIWFRRGTGTSILNFLLSNGKKSCNGAAHSRYFSWTVVIIAGILRHTAAWNRGQETSSEYEVSRTRTKSDFSCQTENSNILIESTSPSSLPPGHTRCSLVIRKDNEEMTQYQDILSHSGKKLYFLLLDTRVVVSKAVRRSGGWGLAFGGRRCSAGYELQSLLAKIG